MAKSEKTEKKSIKTKKFPLKRYYQGKSKDETIEVGENGERILKSQNII